MHKACFKFKNGHLLLSELLCMSRKYPYSPTEGTGISWGWRFCKTQKFKEICEALLEFPEGWGRGDLRKNPFRGRGMDNFWNYKFTWKTCLKLKTINAGYTGILIGWTLKYISYNQDWKISLKTTNIWNSLNCSSHILEFNYTNKSIIICYV